MDELEVDLSENQVEMKRSARAVSRGLVVDNPQDMGGHRGYHDSFDRQAEVDVSSHLTRQTVLSSRKCLNQC